VGTEECVCVCVCVCVPCRWGPTAGWWRRHWRWCRALWWDGRSDPRCPPERDCPAAGWTPRSSPRPRGSPRPSCPPGFYPEDEEEVSWWGRSAPRGDCDIWRWRSNPKLLTLPLQTDRTHSTCRPVSSWKARHRFISWSQSFTAPPSLVLTHTHTHTHTYIYIYIYLSNIISSFGWSVLWACKNKCSKSVKHFYIFIYLYKNMYLYTYVFKYICMYIFIYIYICFYYIYIYDIYIFVYICIYIYLYKYI